jgi:hypothetical protein
MSTDQTAAQFSRARVALQRLQQRVKDAAPTSAGHPQASPALRTLVRRLITAAEKQAT